MNDGRTSQTSQKLYPITMKNYQWVKEETENYLQQRSYVAVNHIGQHPL